MPVVLIADPIEPTRHLLKTIFEEEFGAYVVILDGAGGALLMAREVRPDLVVLELDARRESDLDLIGRIKSDPTPDVPVLAMTAWGQRLNCQQARAAGVDACIEKPFDLDDFVARCRDLLGRTG